MYIFDDSGVTISSFQFSRPFILPCPCLPADTTHIPTTRILMCHTNTTLIKLTATRRTATTRTTTTRTIILLILTTRTTTGRTS